jgi:transcriptional regulator with XRE-family HTH domain
MARNLSPFVEDNERWRNQRRRIPWEERVKLIDEQFPGARDADWNVILRDPDILGRLLKDILKVDQIEPGRAGPRPNLNYERGMQTWREMTGQDYCELPFVQAVRLITKGQAVRVIARKTHMTKTRVDRLVRGIDRPSADDLRAIAAAYGKKPAFFAEYRAEFVTAAIVARLADEPEMTIAIYSKLVKG